MPAALLKPTQQGLSDGTSTPQLALPATASGRQRSGALALSIVAVLALCRLRLSYEPLTPIVIEAAVQSVIVALAHRWQQRSTNRDKIRLNIVITVTLLTVVPWLWQFALRMLGMGTGLEIVMMSSLAWGTVGAACLAVRRRALSTTVICSGFLTLLATCSSDHSVALTFAYVWGALCLWWLTSNHWERVARCQAKTVIESRWQRPMAVLSGCLVFMLAAWSVAGRFPAAERLTWELTPTSGGSSSEDSFARSGVGDGDAVVAAREHAASFGAVDSDVFLDSDQPSLFDLYSDTFGEPVTKKKVERSIALSPQEEPNAQPDKLAQSDGASSKMSTQRRAPGPAKTQKDRASDALLFWIGRPNTHLALERFAQFDGVNWFSQKQPEAEPRLNTQPSNLMPAQVVQSKTIGERTWFTPERLVKQTSTPFMGALPEAIKFARLRSPRIPCTADMLSWHIDKVADPTFFRLDSLDNLSMPDRDRVPEYTIVRYVNRQLDLERLQTQFTVREEAVPPVIASDRAETMAGQVKARQLVQAWTDSMVTDSSWEKIECVLHHLRSEFTFDRTRDFSQADEPLAQFLETRTGNDLMFATAAAVMLEQLGFETRLATGFVAYRQNRLGWTDEIGVYPRDMHAWLEVNVGPGVWAPLEPTPGYPQPQYHVTWRYWVRHHALAILGWTIGLLAMISLLYWQRALAFDCLCGSLGWLLWIGNDRQRCRWLLHVLDLRCRLTGHSRPNHVVPKQWYTRLGNSQPVGLQANASSNHWSASLDVFFREADQLWFGNARTLSTAGREACRVLWYRSTCHSLRTIFQSNSRFVA